MYSIIIPVYNGEKYLRQCISSCLAQSLKGEILVINDGSTDNTQQIINEYKVNFVQLLKNSGTASALNHGIRKAKYDWIKWVSADDMLKWDAMEKMMKLVTTKDRIYYTHYDRINETGLKIGETIEPNLNDRTQEYRNTVLFDHFYGNGSSSLIHKSVFEKCEYFDETLGYQEDYEFWLRACIEHGVQLYLLDINILKYRVHPQQLTEIKKRDAIFKSDSIRKKYPQFKPLAKKYHKSQPLVKRLKLLAARMMYENRYNNNT